MGAPWAALYSLEMWSAFVEVAFLATDKVFDCHVVCLYL
jgi:hypothetical protein